MALLLLLLVLFAAVAVFLIQVIGLIALLAIGADLALLIAALIFVGASLLGGLALSAISRRLPKAPRRSLLVASGAMALATAVELGLSLLLWSSR